MKGRLIQYGAAFRALLNVPLYSPSPEGRARPVLGTMASFRGTASVIVSLTVTSPLTGGLARQLWLG